MGENTRIEKCQNFALRLDKHFCSKEVKNRKWIQSLMNLEHSCARLLKALPFENRFYSKR